LLLLFNVLFVSVANEIYVLANFARTFFLRRVEWFLLVEFVKASRINLGFELGAEGSLRLAHIVPIDRLEEIVRHNFVHAMSAQSIINVAH